MVSTYVETVLLTGICTGSALNAGADVMTKGIGPGCGTHPDVIRHHGQEGADARGDRSTYLAPARPSGLPPFQKLGRMLMRHLDSIRNYCHEEVLFGTVEAITGNIPAMLRRARAYRHHEYLLLKAQKATATRRLPQTV